MRLCVFCGSSPGNKPEYLAAAQQLGTALAKAGIGLVYGGAQVGLMGAVADAALAAGGDVIDRPGYFLAPTIVRDVDDNALIVREEQFGPILPILKYHDLDDVIARANAGNYGLGGSIWSADEERATAAAARIQSGTVWVNQHLALNPTVPFRGAKSSGMGVELGMDGLKEYTQASIINIKRQ